MKQNFLKGFQITIEKWQRKLREYLVKLFKRDVKVLGLYWFTQIELRSILCYSTVKDSTNQNIDYKNKYYILPLLATQVFC